jgi:hypothetical protein
MSMRTLGKQNIRLVDAKFLKEANKRADKNLYGYKQPEPMPYWWDMHNKLGAVLDGCLYFGALIVFVVGVVTLLHFGLNFLLGFK